MAFVSPAFCVVGDHVSLALPHRVLLYWFVLYCTVLYVRMYACMCVVVRVCIQCMHACMHVRVCVCSVTYVCIIACVFLRRSASSNSPFEPTLLSPSSSSSASGASSRRSPASEAFFYNASVVGFVLDDVAPRRNHSEKPP